MAEEEKDEAKEEESGEKSSKKAATGKNPLASVLLLINAVAIGAIGFMQFQLMEKINSQPSIRDVIKSELKEAEGVGEDNPDKELMAKKGNDGLLFPLQGFTSNLAQGDGPRRFVRLTAVLKFSNESKENEFKAREPQIRDVIINILNSKRPEDLLNKEGKNFLKEEIKSAINAFLIEGNVIDIYYTGFQIN